MGKIAFTPGQNASKGDFIQTPDDKQGGTHVAIRNHQMSDKPPRPGASDDNWHYSLGPSSNGKM